MTLIMLCVVTNICEGLSINFKVRIKIINQFTEKKNLLFHGKATANNYTEKSHIHKFQTRHKIQFMNEFLETLEDQS